MKASSILIEPPEHYSQTSDIRWATKRSSGLNDTQTILVQKWEHHFYEDAWVKVPQIEVEN